MRWSRVSSLSWLLAVLPLSSGASAQLTAKRPQHHLPAATVEAPLTQREKAAQLLNRCTFGPRPGDITAVMKLGPDAWFEQQLNPETVPDAVLEKRLEDYPALKLTPSQTAIDFPRNQVFRKILEGKETYPQDPALASVYQVLETKYAHEQQVRKEEQDNQQTPEQQEAQKAAQKKQDQATALVVSEQILGMPKAQRMAAIFKLPVEQRIVLAGSTPDPQKKMLIADFNPHEREIFAAMGGGPDAAHVVQSELQQAKALRAILSERQLQEVMTDFWFNHFNVFLNKDSDALYTPAYERDTIRPHALGKFRDLLTATAKDPAMLVYLDNWLSIGPDSKAAENRQANQKNAQRGLNENYGRELMELHTVGVSGGYTQADVTNLAKILTGWTVDRPDQGGGFLFEPRKHEPGDKQWFRQKVAFQAGPNGVAEGEAALNWLASQSQTAHFISFKLAQRFVADEPPPALVDRMAKSFLSSDGDIREVLRTMERSPEFFARKYYRVKVKTPLEFVASAFRATETNPANPAAVVNVLKTMGEPLYQMQPPTGYPMTADHWMNSAALVDRLNLSLTLTGGKLGNTPFDATHLLATGLLAREVEPVKSPVRRISVEAGEPVSGREEALALLEQMVIGGAVSAKTNAVILKQIAEDQASPSPADSTQVLNTIAALILGSPEFQLK
ncbi:putative signal peptide protein [Acidisarcina polymorpha]|uniref:Putative signal peptide protein n=2 Tax=Acidisarcina polymorpha TaxID=2211140 RepID=A0A2Z5G677_9BACT|nr:putative signal peptide protein [Acidisarcina polymorpha]